VIQLMRHGGGDVRWNWGYVLSLPLTCLLVHGQLDGDPVRAQHTAMLAVVLALPWVVPAFIVVAVISAPLYAWLHTLGPAPEVMTWLGGTVLVGAVIGCHINAALLVTRLRRAPPGHESGLGDFLRRSRNGTAR
jgi:hypothetical protein